MTINKIVSHIEENVERLAVLPNFLLSNSKKQRNYVINTINLVIQKLENINDKNTQVLSYINNSELQEQLLMFNNNYNFFVQYNDFDNASKEAKGFLSDLKYYKNFLNENY